ncbi:MAG: hypothetical protein WDO13_08790 [Verrucomicrobiota bacterium]
MASTPNPPARRRRRPPRLPHRRRLRRAGRSGSPCGAGGSAARDLYPPVGDTLETVGKQWGLTGRQLQKYNHFTNKQVATSRSARSIKIPPAPAK